jgi:hypothetical protein
MKLHQLWPNKISTDVREIVETGHIRKIFPFQSQLFFFFLLKVISHFVLAFPLVL